MTDQDKAHKANTDAVNASVDAWRASQGLPPVDRSKETRKGKKADGAK